MPAGTARTKQASTSVVVRRMIEQAHEMRAQLANEPDPDALAQAIVCAAPILAMARRCPQSTLNWLIPRLAPWEQIALERALVLSTQYAVPSGDILPSHSPTLLLSHSPTLPSSAAHLYEPFLHRYSSDHRNRRGVFFTPQPIADYIVA